MARPPIASIVQTLRASRRPKGGEPGSDQELLARFIRNRDAAAFRALVHRHGQVVFSACRQVLADPADIDDAFQATFLVLLKKVKVLDAAIPLGGWLFAVAHRVAVRCRANNARRRTRESEAARRTRTATELPDLSWREAAAVLHDELNALPDKYRLPLLLCVVHGLTRDEAAEQLGTTVGAVRGQLERGRAVLERRLMKRGVALSAGLLAALMGSSRAPGGPAPELIDQTVRAACGRPGTSVAALAKGAFPMTTLKRTGLAAVLALGLIGAGFGFGLPAPGTSAAAPPNSDNTEKPKADAKAEPKKPEVKERTITGKVLGSEGQPLAAELQLVWEEGKPQPLGKSAADGTFKVTVPVNRGEPGGWLVATRPGHGPDFQPHGMGYIPASMTATAELTLRLPKERPIKGRLLDQQGKPVAGATVAASSPGVLRFRRVHGEALPDLDDRRLQPRGAAERGPRHVVPQPVPESARRRSPSPYAATTDKDGRFTLSGIGANHLVVLRIRGTGVADKEIVTLNRDGFDPAPVNKAARDNEFKGFTFGGKWVLYGPDPAVVLEPEKLIRGRVTDHEGKPRAGVSVTFSRPNKRDLNPDYNQAVTDKDGRYEIRGAHKHPVTWWRFHPTRAAGLLPCQGFADDTVGYEPITIDLKCAKGVVVTGTVKNKATGEPVPSWIYREVLADNPFVENYPPFRHAASMLDASSKTDAAGRYRVVTVPGPVLLMVSPHQGERNEFKPVAPDPKHPQRFTDKYGGLSFYTYGGAISPVQGCWCRVLEAKPTDSEVTVDIELEPATKAPVKVIGPDGKPVTGTKATGVTHVEFAHPTEYPDTDTLTVFNLDPKKERVLEAVLP